MPTACIARRLCCGDWGTHFIRILSAALGARERLATSYPAEKYEAARTPGKSSANRYEADANTKKARCDDSQSGFQNGRMLSRQECESVSS